MSAGYPDFSWSIRVVRTLVIAAVALLSGAVIGGVSVYVISDALTAPPPSAVPNAGKVAADNGTPASEPAPGAANAQSEPVRVVDPAFPPPASSLSVPATAAPRPPDASSAPASQEVVAPPALPAPDASSAQSEEPSAPDAQQQPSPVAEKPSDDANNNPAAARAAAANETEPVVTSAPTKQRAATRTIRPAARDATRDLKQQLRDAAARRPIYDYYDAGDRDRADLAPAAGRTPPGAGKTKSRVAVRRQSNADQANSNAVLPPQPPPAQ